MAISLISLEAAVRIEEEGNSQRDRLIAEAESFPERWLSSMPGRTIDSRMSLLFKDLKDTRFWGVLDALDKDDETRKLAKEYFNQDERTKLLDICINQAILIPKPNTPWPGTTLGHDILYRKIVAKPSMFRGEENGFFDKKSWLDFVKRVNNGRFWERVTDMRSFLGNEGYRVVEDAITNQRKWLTAEFAPEGFRILERKYEGMRNGGARKPCYDDVGFDLNGLSRKGILGFGKFVGEIERNRERLKLEREDVAKLVAPYAIAIMRTDHDEIPLFPPWETSDYRTLMEKGFVAEYLRENGFVRTAVGDEINLKEDCDRSPEHAESLRKIYEFLVDKK
jgi:hypothetical protein